MILLKKSYFLTGLIVYMGLQSQSLVAKKPVQWEGPVPLSMFKKQVRAVRALSTSQISQLSVALASTSVNAGDNALTLLSSFAADQSNLVQAFFAICTALTTKDLAHGNATPISLATTAVKRALSVGVIHSLNNDYNFTLLHYAALFSVFGGTVNANFDVKTPAATIISAILGALTANEQLAAITAPDMWGSTPLHYALLSPAATQLAVVNAIMPTVSIKNAALAAENTYGYRPVHYAAVFIPSAKNVIKAVFNGLTTAQKAAVFMQTDQWESTPLHYAALYKNAGMLDKVFLADLSATQKIDMLQAQNHWEITPTQCATYDVTKTALMDAIIRSLSDAQKLALSFAMPTPYLEVQTVLVPNLLLPQ